MKKLILFFLTAAMIFSMLPVATLAANSGLGNFKAENTYFPGQFTDVSSADWFADEVSAAYELGLVKGTSSTTYSPYGKIKISEVITLASRLHSIYYDNGTEFVQGSPWYQVYVNYAIDNGIIAISQFSDFNSNATRAEFATVLAAALPNEAFKAINDIKTIPDVSDYASYRNAVYKLYNAGILTGNDSYGTFTPNNDIKRSEVAAIISRIAIPTARKEFSLAILNKSGDLSADTKAIQLTVGESKTFNVTLARPSGTLVIDYNTSILQGTWGDWSGDDIPYTITALQSGYSEIKVHIKEDPSCTISIDVWANVDQNSENNQDNNNNGPTSGNLCNHVWQNATCTTPKTCSICLATQGSSLGHTIVIDKAVEATSTSTGLTEGKHCSVCGKVLVAQQVTPKVSSELIEQTTLDLPNDLSKEYVYVASTLYTKCKVESFDYDVTHAYGDKIKLNISLLLRKTYQGETTNKNLKLYYTLYCDGVAVKNSIITILNTELDTLYQATIWHTGDAGHYTLTFDSVRY